MNPILLYELRQSVRNRSVLVAIMLYLAAMTTLTVIVYMGGITIDDYWNKIPGCNDFFKFYGTSNEQLVSARSSPLHRIMGTYLV